MDVYFYSPLCVKGMNREESAFFYLLMESQISVMSAQKSGIS
jgi:hypothetical protein